MNNMEEPLVRNIADTALWGIRPDWRRYAAMENERWRICACDFDLKLMQYISHWCGISIHLIHYE